MTEERKSADPRDEYEGQSVDLYLNEQIQELRVRLEVLGNVQNALRSSLLRNSPELIPEVREAILEVARITEPLWRSDVDRELYQLEIRKAVKMLEYIQ
jgi:archaellum component FlaC